MKINSQYNQIIILIISVMMVVPSWIFSYLQYPNEDFVLKILNDTVDSLYYPLVVNFSELNFKPLYDLNITGDVGVTAYPILSVIIISFFWKLVGPFSLPIIQLLSVFIALNIFYKLSNNNKIIKGSSLFISIFCLTFLFFFDVVSDFLDQNFLQTINNNLQSFYYFRFPRPIITNLFFFLYLYFCYEVFFKNKYNYKNIIILGCISGFTLHIFYFFFIFQNIILFLLTLKKFGLNTHLFSRQNIKLFFIYFLFVAFFLLLYFVNFNFVDKDYLIRLGTIDLDIEKKIILLKYYFNFLLNKFFIILFLINIVIYYINKNYFKIDIFEYLNIIFFSIIISPFIFFIFSPKAITVYHFFNWILISGSINFIFFLLYTFGLILNDSTKKKLQYIYIILSVLVVNYKLISNNFVIDNSRVDESEIINFINLNKKNTINKKFLVPDQNIFAWLSINKFNNFEYVPQEMWTVRSNNRLEKDIIKVFKFFDLDINDFDNYIENKNDGFRMMNRKAYNFLGRKYVANQLKTFEDSNDYENYEFIKTIKPIISHSFAIPRYEINRLLEKFNKVNEQIQPDYILIKRSGFFQFENFEKKNYCILKNNSTFILYSLNNCD
tara:strand:- start:381 stop:2207 length:1827 start_codon:yes stop_codon:yes gene_type:complete